MVKAWSDARARVEEEIWRKHEHLTEANNFKEVRAFVRKDGSKKLKWCKDNRNYEDIYYD
jgi:hypothetical protein